MYSEPKGLYFWWIQVAYIKLRGIYFLALLNTKYWKFQVSIGFWYEVHNLYILMRVYGEFHCFLETESWISECVTVCSLAPFIRSCLFSFKLLNHFHLYTVYSCTPLTNPGLVVLLLSIPVTITAYLNYFFKDLLVNNLFSFPLFLCDFCGRLTPVLHVLSPVLRLSSATTETREVWWSSALPSTHTGWTFQVWGRKYYIFFSTEDLEPLCCNLKQLSFQSCDRSMSLPESSGQLSVPSTLPLALGNFFFFST